MKRQHSLVGVLKVTLAHMQRRINHWSNRANAWGLELLGPSRLKIKTLLYWFSCFWAVHHASKLRSFLIVAFSRLYRLGKLKNLAFIVWSDFEVIEPNSK